ncbi:DNA repair protein RecN [Yinghuangia soli]|uniref:DNA repair protein RecN n=1 Tax=Yinghuangia soli TaxID=2908204 RepID=A0AA41U7F6_9ACTN|nr:DNA repair protein RecN [Yinghuangia soli]MCF2531914.1 DNA repair protein RecN [Yinghuangia soli]
MRIQGLGVIEDAVVELAAGFTVVTGETGAGKTMVVTGLGLLFGGRADAGLVRTGQGRAVVEGRVRLSADAPAAVRAAEAGAELDEDALLLSRTVSAEGRSRAHVGGRAAPVGLLTDLAEELIAVHGQTDQQRLLRPSRQRASLDRYAGEAVAKPLASYARVYKRLRTVVAELETITTRARERAQEADLLRFGLNEVEQAAPLPGEDVELAAETERLGHADALRGAATTAHAALLSDPEAGDEGPDAVTLIGAARRAVEAVAAHDPALAALAERLGEVGYLVSDVATELASYAAGVDADPVRLALAEERRSVLSGLTRKYGADIGEVLAWAERSAMRLAELDGDDDRVGELAEEREALRAELAELAGEVSAARAAAAGRFADAVTIELGALAMPHARVSVAITGVDDAEGLPVGGRVLAYGPSGVDEVELLLAPHPGAPPRALNKGASGGELSRVMLAVEVVFAGADPVPTFVFDEVDAGVGGKAAVEVGRRLAMLARSAQVIVVTHLPQVAAFADRHLVVEKSNDGTVTRSGVVALDDEARVRELSRMLAGLEDSELGRAHAEELLATAAKAKRG